MRFRPVLLIPLATALTLTAAGAAGAANVTVNATAGLTFSPASVTIQVGDSVTWVNSNAGIHNVRADDGSFRCANGCDGQGGNGALAANWTATRVFNTAGTFRYYCEAHGGPNGSGMSGMVIVQGAASNPGTLRFSGSSYNVNEGGGTATITVQRVGGDDGAASVAYSTSNGSATAGSDYTAASGTLNWANNDDNNKAFSVPILNDSTPESNETVNLMLASATGAALGSPSTATLTIVDNDSGGNAGTLSFTAAEQSVAESAGSATVSVQRTGGSNGAVSVAYSTSNGSATAGDDYTAAAGTVSFANGDTANKTFTVAIGDDAAIEGDETINVNLANPTGGAALGSPSSQTVTILDDDLPMGPCVDDEFTLCLQDDRFRVTVDFRAPSDTLQQRAHRVPLSNASGLFWFFSDDNFEMLLKVVNACIPILGDRFWVFYAATTNVEFTITVVDTDAKVAKVYRNPQGMAALPVQDTNAFATCP